MHTKCILGFILSALVIKLLLYPMFVGYIICDNIDGTCYIKQTIFWIINVALCHMSSCWYLQRQTCTHIDFLDKAKVEEAIYFSEVKSSTMVVAFCNVWKIGFPGKCRWPEAQYSYCAKHIQHVKHANATGFGGMPQENLKN